MTTIFVQILAVLAALALLGGLAYLLYSLGQKVRQAARQPVPGQDDSVAPQAGEAVAALAGAPSIRLAVIALVALVMLIPLGLVENLVAERHKLYRQVLVDIAELWGGEQLVQGPLLVVPFVERHVTEEQVDDPTGGTRTVSRTRLVERHAIILPRDLRIGLKLGEQFRMRGIYRSLVYVVDVRMNGRFRLPAIADLSNRLEEVRWDDAFVAVGLTDTRAINGVSALDWAGERVEFRPGTRLADTLVSGFHAHVPGLDAGVTDRDFALEFSANGSAALRFAAFGATTRVDMESTWPHPSFQGSTLPGEYSVGDEGFTASWEIPSLARNFPQAWVQEERAYNLAEFQAGVDLFEPVFLYSKVNRAVKYGVLFIALTFLTFLVFELTIQARLHFVQYALIGLALSLFFLILLSLAEHISFPGAYVAASAVTILLITAYAWAALGRPARAAIVCVLLTALYVVLYSLLQLEDYALLMGTGLLVAVLAVLMYLTRNLRPESSL